MGKIGFPSSCSRLSRKPPINLSHKKHQGLQWLTACRPHPHQEITKTRSIRLTTPPDGSALSAGRPFRLCEKTMRSFACMIKTWRIQVSPSLSCLT